MEAAKALLPAFIKKCSTEVKVLFYEFTICGDEIFCREGYQDADGALVHLANVGDELGQLMQIADLHRLELHGPAAELDKLRDAAAHLNPRWFVTECGLSRA